MTVDSTCDMNKEVCDGIDSIDSSGSIAAWVSAGVAAQ